MGSEFAFETQPDRVKQPSFRSSPTVYDSSNTFALVQRDAGNQAVQHLLRSGYIHAKLAISNPDDPEEREADHVAHTIMRSHAVAPASSPCSCSHDGEMCEECQQKQSQPTIQRLASAPSAPANVPRIVSDVLRSPGHPLDSATRAFFEPRFGQDFSHVRVHTDSHAAESARSINANAYTAGTNIVFARDQYAPDSDSGRTLLAHELTHTLQQAGPPAASASANAPLGPDPIARVTLQAPTSVIHRDVAKSPQPVTPSNSGGIEVEVVGADTSVNEPIVVVANRAAQGGGRVLRVSSVENMIHQLEGLLSGNTCLGKLVVWYHGAPEIQLLVGEYPLGPKQQRLPASGFTREWLQLDSNRAALNRFRHLFCCGGLMHWIGCSTASVRASGGLRTPEELERNPELEKYPDFYTSVKEAQKHGAVLQGASFGAVNVQAWANATCTTIRSATNLVTIIPKSPQPVTIDEGGRWVDVHPQRECQCDPVSGRVAGDAPSRSEMVKDWQTQIAALVGKENVEWHELLLALRTGVPHATEVVGAGEQGERTFEAKPGTLPAALLSEMHNRQKKRRGPLEKYYSEKVLFPLLRIAAADVTPPAPLPNIPMPNHLFVRIAVGGTWAAVTQPHLAVTNRDDFWHWTVYNDRAVGETPEFTRTVVQHELEHAADFEKDLMKFEADHPRPQSPIPDQFTLPAEGAAVKSWTGDWGRYINDFIAFQEGSSDPARHFEIIRGQRRQTTRAGASSWDKWSAGERAYWFELIFHNLPARVPRSSKLAGEDEVLSAYATADSALKLAVIQRAFDTIHGALHPDPHADPAAIAHLRDSAQTLLLHFDDIIARVLHEHFYDTTRDSLVSLLQRGSSGGL
jgi:hypothetical protein